MASRLPHFCTLLSLILCLFSPAPSIAATNTSPEAICSTTPHASYCRSILPNKPGTVHDYCRFSVRKALSTAYSFRSFVNKHFKFQSQYSQSTIRALGDCQFLANRNIKYLSAVMLSINSTDTLPTSKTDQMWAFLSAVMTNLDTCLGSLQTSASSSVANDLSPYLSNGTMLNSVSLALFRHGWASDSKTRGRRLWDQRDEDDFFNGKMRVSKWPLKNINLGHARSNSFAKHPLGLWSSRTGRRLFQLDGMDVEVNDIVTVNPDGSGNFTTINDAVSAAPNNSIADSGYFLIYVVAGVYQEYVSIPENKQYLLMVGDGINQTIITGNRSVADGWTTYSCQTFVVEAEGFVAVNITFRNTAGAIKYQAVALRSEADLSAFYSCSFEAYQDTLYTHSLRQFYRECDIYGTIDFIFGDAAVVFQDCNIYSRQPLNGQFNCITAQGRSDPNQNTGTSIHNCSIRAASDLASSNYTVQTYLGRPWKEYSRTVFMQSFMDSLINPAGWHEWSGTFALDTLYYGEYNNTGPGSDLANRVQWTGYHIMNRTDAQNFTVSNFIVGDFWLPQTGIPYNGDLL
ncbi:hypothetical protein Ancab_024232 [Ancistrocladus abbreviatus]